MAKKNKTVSFRNFVAKNAGVNKGGAHRDKKKDYKRSEGKKDTEKWTKRDHKYVQANVDRKKEREWNYDYNFDESTKRFNHALVKRAVQIALKNKDDYTHAYREIEKIAKGLSKEPEVQRALRVANENYGLHTTRTAMSINTHSQNLRNKKNAKKPAKDNSAFRKLSKDIDAAYEVVKQKAAEVEKAKESGHGPKVMAAKHDYRKAVRHWSSLIPDLPAWKRGG